MTVDTLNRDAGHLANPILLRKIDELESSQVSCVHGAGENTIYYHYFNEELQVSRGNRMAELLERKARREVQTGAFGKEVVTTDNLFVDLESVRYATTSKSNAEHVKEELHDILQSYYKVARKRFVDNVYHQAADHCLLTRPASPLAVFSQE
jgi:hypothetical protein